MYKFRYISDSPEATQRFASSLAPRLQSGDILALQGDLASGKTTFTRGLSRYFRVKEDVTSPTFTLINEYHGDRDLYHFDCYRLKKAEEILFMGLDDYLSRDGLIIIEWPEIVSSLLPESAIHLQFVPGKSDNERIIDIESGRELDL